VAEPFAGFEIGKRYHLQRQMHPASPGYGTYFGGIQPKGTYPKTEGVIVLATIGTGARYGNRWDGDTLVYSGEDVRGRGANASTIDQSPEAGANRVLTQSGELDIPVYCFWAHTDDPDWEYLGVGEIESWSLEQRGIRKVVEYRISFLNVPSAAAAAAQRRQIEQDVAAAGAPNLTVPGGREREGATRRVRSQVFSELVKRAYSDGCAICGEARKDAQGRPEVQAAHIYPVEKEGPDDVRNGLALCRLHHWAFDGALLGVGTDLVIRVFEAGRQTAGVSEFDGRALALLPEEAEKRPHKLYLGERFELSRKGWTRGSEGDTS
jgi:putative restriction endonuclease